MAEALITNVETVNANGVRIMFFNDDSRIADMNAAEEKFLIPILGKELYEILLDEVDEENSDYEELIKKCRKALAPLAYWLDLPNIQSGITDRGAGTFVSQNMEPMHAWEYNKLSEGLEDKGGLALNNLIEFLYANATYYSWTAPNSYSSIIKSGNEFAEYYHVYQPYRTFENLRPFVKQVEQLNINDLIGEAFYTELKGKTKPNDDEKKVITYIKFAVANHTIAAAATKLPVRISAEGFTTALAEARDRVNAEQQMARAKEVDIIRSQAVNDGDAFLMKAKNYLDEKASETLFTTYKSSDKYTAPVPPEEYKDPNECRRGIFGM